MKKIFFILSLIPFLAQAQKFNPVPQKTDFRDTVKFSKLKNNAAGDSILATDTAGQVKLIKKPTGSATDTTLLIQKADTITRVITPKQLKDSIKNLVDYLTLSSVTDIASFNSYAKSISVIDTIRGGKFNLYIGADAADNGMIFTDALSRKWKREVSDTKINVAWYGAVAVNSITDQRGYIIAARDYIYNHPESFLTLKIPASASGYYYVISDSILFDKDIRIEGEGTLWGGIKSKVYCVTDKSGFVFRYAYGDAPASASIENVYFTQQTSTNKNTFAVKSCEFIHMKNVAVDNFAGNGIIISACATAPIGDDNNYGNADHSIIEYTSTYSCGLNGIYVTGCDANVIQYNNISSNSNLRWGVFDNGFLGSNYLQPHLAANAYYGIGGNSTVSYGGKYYVALPGYDGYSGDALDSNYNKQPDLNVGTYWYEIPAIFCGSWSNTTRYYSGGTICIKSASAWTTITTPYAESAQAPFYLGGKAKIDNGDIVAAGAIGGAWWVMNGGDQIMHNANLILDKKLSIGGGVPGAPLDIQIHNDGIIENDLAMILQSPATANVQQEFISTAGTGYISWTAAQFGHYILGTGWIDYVNANGIEPGADVTFNLGKSGVRWKDFYASLSPGIGNKAVRTNTATGKTTYVDTLSITTTGTSGAATLINNILNIPQYSGGSGVTSVATNTGSGITGGTITTTGTIAADTVILGTRLYSAHQVDSALTANAVTFRNTTTDYKAFKYISNTYTWKGDRPGYGILIDSTSAGDSVKIFKVDTATIGPWVRSFITPGGGGIGNVTQDTNHNVQINNSDSGYAAIPTAAATTTFTVSTKYNNNFTGSTTQTVVLPAANTLTVGHGYYLTNTSTGVVTVNMNGGTLLQTMLPGTTLAVTVTDVSSTTGVWNSEYSGGNSVYADADATDADFTAIVNSTKLLPAATLTANRTITIPTGVNGNTIEIYNNEAGFTWNLSGATVYLLDRTTTVTSLLGNGTAAIFKKISGKWVITN